MTRKAGNGAPTYQKIQGELRERIESGQLKPGDAVDSERELASIHGVSLMTARHALVSLEREGFVERRRGAGTFVAQPKIHFNRLMSYTEQMASRGLTPRSKLLCLKVIEGEPDIAARLSLPATTSLIMIERLRHAADEPFALETCYLSAPEFPQLVSVPLGRTSLFGSLEHDYGVELAYADEEIDATGADPRTAELMGIQGAMPLLRIRQVIYSTKGKATVYVMGLYRSDRHNLLIRRFR
ncbi:MAG: GntR family transcriptional regulator [Terriglobales bacterium]